MACPEFPIFQAEPRTTVGTRWATWLSRFNNLLVAMDISDKKRQRALLKHFIGEEHHTLLDTLPDAGGDEDYDKACKALSTLVERYNFRQTKQETGESFDSFYAKLRRLSTHCDFTDPDGEIKSKIIQTCLSSKLRTEYLSKTHTLDEIMAMGRTYESVNLQTKVIEGKTASSIKKDNDVNKLKYNAFGSKNKTSHQITSKQKHQQAAGYQPKTCYGCGGNWPHKGGRQKCPAYGKTCNFCGWRNHFAKMCKNKSQKNEKSTPQKKSARDSRLSI